MRRWCRVGGVWVELVEWCVVDSEELCLPGMELPFKTLRYDDRMVPCREVCGVHLAIGLYWPPYITCLACAKGLLSRRSGVSLSSLAILYACTARSS